jgi:Cytochrome c oxidase subunit IIa family
MGWTAAQHATGSEDRLWDFRPIARPSVGRESLTHDRRREPEGSPTVDDDTSESEPRPRGALVLILIYLLVIAAFWLNTYLRIWRS